MKYTNITTIKDFIITGFPGLPPEYFGIVSVLLLLVYLVIVFGNALIIGVIIYERILHKPTYLIFCHLAMTDIFFGTVTLPKIIARYWWNDMITSFGVCFAQMYFVHALGATSSLILFMMALDRFIAIWLPLRYQVLFTNKRATICCILCWGYTFISLMGITLHALTLPYCDLNVILQCYCDHISITRLACGDGVANVKSGALGNAMITLMLPLTFIIFSYFSIIIAVLRMPQTESRYKVLSTCAPQIFITCLYYMPRCFVYLTNVLGFKYSLDASIIITMMYSLIPAAANPVIYSLKTRDIKNTLIKIYRNRKISFQIKR